MKESICEELKNKYKINLDKDFVLIRDYQLEKPTKVTKKSVNTGVPK